jgi:hypothetical protein
MHVPYIRRYICFVLPRVEYCDLMASSNYMFDHMRSKEARSTHYQDMHEACYPFINSWKV